MSQRAFLHPPANSTLQKIHTLCQEKTQQEWEALETEILDSESGQRSLLRLQSSLVLHLVYWYVKEFLSYELLFPANETKMEANMIFFDFIAWWTVTRRNTSHYGRSYWKYIDKLFSNFSWIKKPKCLYKVKQSDFRILVSTPEILYKLISLHPIC